MQASLKNISICFHLKFSNNLEGMLGCSQEKKAWHSEFTGEAIFVSMLPREAVHRAGRSLRTVSRMKSLREEHHHSKGKGVGGRHSGFHSALCLREVKIKVKFPS